MPLTDGLERKARELYDTVRRLEGEKFDLQELLTSHNISLPPSTHPFNDLDPSELTLVSPGPERASAHVEASLEKQSEKSTAEQNGAFREANQIDHDDEVATSAVFSNQPIGSSDDDVMAMPIEDKDEQPVSV